MDLQDLRHRLAGGHFEFSRHALRRSIERSIADADIIQAGGNAVIIEDYPTDKYSPSCLLLGFAENGRALHLHVCYRDPSRVKVITLYEPDPAEWIDNKIRRQP